MPAELPPTSAYTYCAELTVDEAEALDAVTVRFKSSSSGQPKPVYYYIQNYRHFPVGVVVPNGSYDRTRALWTPDSDGRVVQIVAISDGKALLDVDGDAAGDDAEAELGVSDDERTQLALRYAVGTELVRVPLAHFTPVDFNFDFGPDGTECVPGSAACLIAGLSGGDTDCALEVKGSIIECENQILGQRIGVAGTGYSLNYRSDRVPGRGARYQLHIPLVGPSGVRPNVFAIWWKVAVAGRLFKGEVACVPGACDPGASVLFDQWDGTNSLGQPVQGAQRARIQVGYVHRRMFSCRAPGGNGGSRFASWERIGGYSCTFPWDLTGWVDYVIWGKRTFWLGTFDSRPQGLGGWTLSAHHTYLPFARQLYRGDGTRQNVAELPIIIREVGDSSTVGIPRGIVAAPDGSLIFATNHMVKRMVPGGATTTIAGGASAGDAGDGLPAVQAQLYHPFDVALAPDGSIYIADLNNNRIRRIDPAGIIDTVAGTGTASFSGDGGPAVDAELDHPSAVSVAPDGTLIIVDRGNRRIRAVYSDGRIETIAGTSSSSGSTADNTPADNLALSAELGDALATEDGELLIADSGHHVLWRVDITGIARRVAGKVGEAGAAGDGLQANDPAVRLNYPIHIL